MGSYNPNQPTIFAHMSVCSRFGRDQASIPFKSAKRWDLLYRLFIRVSIIAIIIFIFYLTKGNSSNGLAQSQVTQHSMLSLISNPTSQLAPHLTCVLDGPTALRGTLMSNPPLGSFSPLRQGSFGGSLAPSQSQTVFRMA